MIVRIFKLFDFQPRMGVITRSLALAGPELLNFFILWLIFFVGYSFMAHMIFGRSVEDVSLTSQFVPVLLFFHHFVICELFSFPNYLASVVLKPVQIVGYSFMA
jgi:hypothetical protein